MLVSVRVVCISLEVVVETEYNSPLVLITEGKTEEVVALLPLAVVLLRSIGASVVMKGSVETDDLVLLSPVVVVILVVDSESNDTLLPSDRVVVGRSDSVDDCALDVCTMVVLKQDITLSY